MKNKLPLILIILTVLSVALAVGYTVYERSQSSPGMPQISFDKSSIEAGVDASDEELLRGVTASDPEDGDITDSLIVEGISRMHDGSAKVSYVAFDSQNHLARAERTVRFTDYRQPVFSFTKHGVQAVRQYRHPEVHRGSGYVRRRYIGQGKVQHRQ